MSLFPHRSRRQRRSALPVQLPAPRRSSRAALTAPENASSIVGYAVFAAVLLSPLRHYRGSQAGIERAKFERDSFPLSTYPMFSTYRRGRITVPHVIGFSAEGERIVPHYRHFGAGGLNQVRRQISRALRQGQAAAVAQRYADSLAAARAGRADRAQAAAAPAGAAQAAAARAEASRAQAAQAGDAQTGAALITAAQVGAAQTDTAHADAAQTGAAHATTGQTDATQSTSVRATTAQAGTAQVSAAPVTKAHTEAAQADATQSTGVQASTAPIGAAAASTAPAGARRAREARIVRVEVVRSRFEFEAYFAGTTRPALENVHAHCLVGGIAVEHADPIRRSHEEQP